MYSEIRLDTKRLATGGASVGLFTGVDGLVFGETRLPRKPLATDGASEALPTRANVVVYVDTRWAAWVQSPVLSHRVLSKAEPASFGLFW